MSADDSALYSLSPKLSGAKCQSWASHKGIDALRKHDSKVIQCYQFSEYYKMLTWTQSLEQILYQLLEDYSSLFSQQKPIKKNLHVWDGYQPTNGILVAVAHADLSNTNNRCY